ncbi:copper amine oxidase N-terminal domain-containing protein [Paenibacillus puldeungensis]|uniref:Copper amine oxidase N-terminal domain-containing protein n=1 Tax=Paenibacillus puldeungensis TaxID=696536 RepID=A0ABW3RWN5_9BACL
MRKVFMLIAAFSLLFSFGPATGWGSEKAFAEESMPQIKDIINKDTMLMDNGVLWSRVYGLYEGGLTRTPANLVSGTDNTESSGGLGITKDGKLMEWDIFTPPIAVEGQTGIKQVSGKNWLKNDGTVWSKRGKYKNLDSIEMIAYGDKMLAALSSNGQLLFEDRYKLGVFKKLGTISDVASVKAIAAYEDGAAVLYNSGKVVLYQTFEFDDNGNIIPFTVADDAVHIAFAASTAEHPTKALVVTRKDGSVWTTGNYKDRVKLTKQMSGLSQIVKTAGLKNLEHFYAQRSDGSWLLYNEGEVSPVDVPSVSSISLAISDKKPYVGDSLEIDIQETYTNGAKIKVPAGQSDFQIEKPQLLRLQPDGKVKVLGVGETKITVSSSGKSESVTISASLHNNLKFSKLVNGVVYLPANPVFQAIGGTVTSLGGGIDVKLGETSLSVRPKDSHGVLNGETIQLKAAPTMDKGSLLIPASLLTDVLGANVQWDNKWKQANISFGAAHMAVVSSETASLIKKAAQGNLAKFIGRSYWVNYFQDWTRFSKVTVTDIVPEDSGDFVIEFKTGSGKTLKSYAMTSSSVSQLFSDRSSFFNFDPYKKYKWSAATWNQIKAGHISMGMTKEQVQLSWGDPSGRSTTMESGQTIETWVYANFDIVGFINGKVAVILS